MRPALLFALLPVMLSQPAAAWEQSLKGETATTLQCDQKDNGPLACVKKTREHQFLTHLIGGPEHEVLVLRIERDVWERYPAPPGADGKVTVSAWKFHLGEEFDFSTPPLYSFANRGISVELQDFLVLRSLGRSAYFDLASGEHAFDSTSNQAIFGFNPARYDWRFGTYQAFAKLGYPGHPGAVGVVTFGTEGKVLQQALLDIGSDKTLRQFFSGHQTVTSEVAWVHPDGSPVKSQQLEENTENVRLELRLSVPAALLGAPAESLHIRVPVSENGLDMAHAELPQGLRLTAWPPV